MKTKQLNQRQIIAKVHTWNTSILKEALYNENILTTVESYILSELCYPLSQKGNIPFEKILKVKAPEDFLKSSPSLFIEFLFLIKKYQPDLYKKELINLIDNYESILDDIWNDLPDNISVFFMLNMISSLKGITPKYKELLLVNISEESFLFQSKAQIDKNLNHLLMASGFGQKKIELTQTTIEAIETIMLDAAAKYDLILVTKALRVLIYAEVKHSYSSELVYNFLLQNQSIEGYIGHYDAEFIQTKTVNIAHEQQLHITKEIVIAVLEYKNNYRHIRDFIN